MSSENASSSCKKKLLTDDCEMAFAIIPKDSIKLIAEAAGYSDLSEDVATVLSEDVSYRLREVTMNSAQYMKHGKRRKLVTEDFNKALRKMDVQPIYGHGSGDSLSFKQIRDGDLHFIEETDVNFCDIALGRYVPKNLGETTIKADWLAIEGVAKTSTLGKVKKELPEDLLNYYTNITNGLLSTETEVRKVALDDLRTNPNIVPLLSYFVNYVCYGVKTVSHDIAKLTILLHTITSLINNPNLDLTPTPYLNLLVQAVMYNLTEPVATSFNNSNDHWSLRDYSSRLLGDIVRKWSNPLNHLLYNTVKELKDVLFDLNKPFCSHYGAIMGLIALGTKTVEQILLPNLSTFWSHLNLAMEDTSIRNALVRADAYKVYGALLLAAELLIKKRFEEFKKENNIDTESHIVEEMHSDSAKKCMFGGVSVLIKSPQDLYSELYEYFGDSLTIRVDQTSMINIKEYFPPAKDEKLVTLSDADGLKSGEELLAEFMEQVRVQELLDQEKRIQDEKDRIIQEKKETEVREEEEKKRRQIQELLKQKQEDMAIQRWEEEKRRREEDGKRKRDDMIRKEREKKRRQERRKREEERRRVEEDRRREELLVTIRQPRHEGHKVNYKEDDDDIDVEADDDSDYVPDRPVVIERKSDNSDNTDEYHSDGQVVPQPHASHEPQPHASHVPQPHASHVPQPHASHVPQPQASHVPQPHATHVPQSHATHVPQSHASHVPQSHASHVPQPHASHVPQPHASHVPQPHASHVPQPHASHVHQHYATHTGQPYSSHSGPSQEGIGLTSTITNPGGGIKIKIKRQPTYPIKSDEMEGSSHSEKTPERKEKQKKKRKSSQKTDLKIDPFEFLEKSDTDEYALYRPRFTSQQYSPGTDDSGESDNSFRKSKLTLKLKVPSPHLSDSSKK